MKKRKFPKIKIQKRFYKLLILLGCLVILIGLLQFFPAAFPGKSKDFSYSIFTNSYTHKSKDFDIKLKNSDVSAISEVSSGDSKVSFLLKGYTVENVSNTKLFDEEDTESVLYSLNGGVSYLQYQVLRNEDIGDGLKENIVLKDQSSPRAYKFNIDLKNISSYKKTKDGWTFYDLEKKPVFNIPPGVMQDSKKVRSADVKINIKKENGKDILTINPSDAWLDSPERVYPVYVDPTVSVVVSGGIVDLDAQFGGLQRKIVESDTGTITPDGTITFEQSKSGQTVSTASTVAVSFDSTPTAGNLVVVAASCWTGPIDANGVTDNQGNTYTQIVSREAVGASGVYVSLFYASNISSSGTFTVTFNCDAGGGTDDMGLAIHEYSGASTTSPLVTSNSASGTGTSGDSGNITTTSEGQMYFGATAWVNSTATSSVGGGYTLREEEQDNDGTQGILTEDKFGDAQTTSATATYSTTTQWAVVTAAFTPSFTIADTGPAWYTVYGDSSDIYYKKSTDLLAATWGSAVDIDDSDTDNYNPTIWKDGTDLYVAWIDDSTDSIEFRSINAADGDALSTICTSPDMGTLGSSFLVSITVTEDGTVYVATTDTAADTEVNIYSVTGCTFTDITTGSGLTAGDRPVLTSYGNTVYMAFQDGDLSRSVYSGTEDAWKISNEIINAATNSNYSIGSNTDGNWLLSISGTTSTRLDGFGNMQYTALDSSVGTVGRSDIDCVTVDDCKIVYFDDAADDVIFLDCNDELCSAPTASTIDSNVGTGVSNVAIDCPSVTDCKVVFLDSTNVNFADCNNAACSAPTITTGLEVTASDKPVAIDCPAADNCKVVGYDQGSNNLFFTDCPNAACSGSTPTYIDGNPGSSMAWNAISIQCPTSSTCKVAYISNSGSGELRLAACTNEACTNANVTDNTVVAASVGNSGNVSMSCPPEGCSILFQDETGSDLEFVQCLNNNCSSSAITVLDSDVSASSIGLSLDCVTAATCRAMYDDNETGVEDLKYIQCENASCSTSNIGSLNNDVGTPFDISISCVASSSCRTSYFNQAAGDIVFLSCFSEGCGLLKNYTAPWTSETNIIDASLTVTNEGMLFAHIIKDATEQVYYKASQANINDDTAWNSETSLGFSTGDLSQLSSVFNETSTDMIGVVVRQGSNLEVAAYDLATLANQTSILSRIGTNTDTYAEGAPVFVQTSPKGTVCVGTSAATSFSTLPSEGSLIVVPVWGWSSTTGLDFAPGSVTDNQGNTYTRALQSTMINNARTAIYYAYNIGNPSGTFTITLSSVAGCTAIGASEFTGMLTTDPLDKSTSNTGTSSTPSTGTTAATDQAGELAVASMVSLQFTNSAISNTAGYTEILEDTDGSAAQAGEGNYKILDTIGTQESTWSLAAGSNDWSTSIATFKAAPGTQTLFSRLQQIDDTKIGVTADDGADTTLFGRFGFNTDTLQCSDNLTGWNVAAAQYASKSFSINSQDSTAEGVFFKPDGLTMYAQGVNTDAVYQYTLSTAWDVSTATYASKSLSVGTQDTAVRTIFFSEDGSKMYAMGNTNSTVYQYTLSTPWDLSTGSYASKSFSVISQDTSPEGVFFKSDGLTMYMVGNTNNTIYQYTLSTAWDVSTATYASLSFSVGSQDTSPRSLFIDSTGSRLYISGNTNDAVFQYSLSTAWDISTAVYSSKSLVVSQEPTPRQIFFSANGLNLYVIGSTNNTVYQYALDFTTGSCTNLTLFGLTRNNGVAREKRFLSIFGGDGRDSFIASNSNLVPGMYQFNGGGTVTGTIAPNGGSQNTTNAALYLFYAGNLTVNGSIDVSGFGNNGGDGGNGGNGVSSAGPGEGGAGGLEGGVSGTNAGANGTNATGHTSRGVGGNGGAAVDLNSVAGAGGAGGGGGGGGGANSGYGGGGGGGGASQTAGANGGNGGSNASGFAAATVTQNNDSISQKVVLSAKSITSNLFKSYGAGGGGGGGAGGGATGSSGGGGGGGGGGGAGGGILYIEANRVLVNAGGSILSMGQNGGNGGNGGRTVGVGTLYVGGNKGSGGFRLTTPTEGGVGGNGALAAHPGGGGAPGGGGGGGVIYIRTHSFTNNGTISANGGLSGANGLRGGATGFNGGSGSAGANGFVFVEIIP